MSRPSHDHQFNLALLGAPGSGKSSILTELRGDSFHEEYKSTIGVDFNICDTVHDDKKIKLNLWDCAGQKRFNNIIATYLHKRDGFLLVIGLDHLSKRVELATEFDLASFTAQYAPFVKLLEETWNEAKPQQLHIIISKADLASTEGYVNVKNAEINLRKWINSQEFFNDKNITVHVCSAKTDVATNEVKTIRTVFQEVTKSIYNANVRDLDGAATVDAAAAAPNNIRGLDGAATAYAAAVAPNIVTASEGLDKIATSNSAINHFKVLFLSCRTDDARKRQKQQVLEDLKYLIHNNFSDNEHSEKLLDIGLVE